MGETLVIPTGNSDDVADKVDDIGDKIEDKLEDIGDKIVDAIEDSKEEVIIPAPTVITETAPPIDYEKLADMVAERLKPAPVEDKEEDKEEEEEGSNKVEDDEPPEHHSRLYKPLW